MSFTTFAEPELKSTDFILKSKRNMAILNDWKVGEAEYSKEFAFDTPRQSLEFAVQIMKQEEPLKIFPVMTIHDKACLVKIPALQAKVEQYADIQLMAWIEYCYKTLSARFKKKMMDNKIDEAIEESFPASDPPSWNTD